MKPITYWIQNEAIDQLVEAYGDQLQRMTTATRRDLIAELLNGSDYGDGDSEALRLAYTQVESLTRREKDFLIEAIAATLTHTHNPWVEGARKMVAIEQAHKKEGIPSH